MFTICFQVDELFIPVGSYEPKCGMILSYSEVLMIDKAVCHLLIHRALLSVMCT